ncbi:MAG: rhodanese-like domain-containing protein [Candidatus Kapaibacterium sp.]|nr:MAG: rhodanese-like domain-containing protein [Candidatus Kapabacteria bacterium]
MKHPIFSWLAAILFLSFVHSCTSLAAPYKTLSAQEAQAFLAQTPDAIILDVRTAEEFHSETGHLPKAVLIPVQELEKRIGELAAKKKHAFVVYCRSGSRSKRASEILAAQGFSAFNLDGGIMAWNAAHYPVEH